MKLTKSLIGICFVFFAVNVFAATSEQHVAQKTSELKVVGQAKMRWLMFPLYQVTLKTEDGRYQENRYPQQLDILYLRNIHKQDLLTATDGEWRGLGIPQAQRQQWIAQLGKLWPMIKRGDRLSFQVNTGGDNFFTFNGKKIGGVADQQFGRSFLAIWLSPKTSRPGIRNPLPWPTAPRIGGQDFQERRYKRFLNGSLEYPSAPKSYVHPVHQRGPIRDRVSLL